MKKTILLAEDSPTQAEQIRFVLERAGYVVKVVPNGREGMKRVKTETPDLIISDVMMPDLDGYAFCRAVKSNEATKRIPFVLLTERRSAMDVAKGLERGADNFITKPFEDEALLERVHRIFENLELRKKRRLNMEVHLRIGRQDITINSDKQQIFELLFATFEDLCRTNEALQQSRSKLEQYATRLEEQVQEMEAFSYSISHDLRAPLRHIDGFAGLLQKHAAGLDEKAQRFIEAISQSAKRMAQLIDDLLEFSRTAKSELVKNKVMLDQLLTEVLNDLRSNTENRNITWKVSHLPEVYGDRALLRQVLFNLVANAIKYTSSREAAVIEIGRIPSDREDDTLFVRDNGVGFDMKYAQKLFGVFQRLHSADEFEGTGIGLAIVRRIIQKHGGRVWAEGTVGLGATFYFTLPRKLTDAFQDRS
jgi:signal transduction histidine kinase